MITEDVTVYILGEKARSEAFATTSPEIPLMIIRDPPGDMSYSFVNDTYETSLSFSMYTRDALNTSLKKTISLGYDFSIESGFIISTTTDIETTLDFGSQFNTYMSQNSRTENQFTFITTSIYQTSEERRNR